MTAFLKRVAERENVKVSDNALGVVARAAKGGMRDALTFLDMLVAFCGAEVEDDKVPGILGVNDPFTVLRFIESIYGKDADGAFRILHDWLRRGTSLSTILQDCLGMVKDLSLIRSIPPEHPYWSNRLPELTGGMTRLAKETPVSVLTQYFGILTELEAQIRRSAFAEICFEMAILKMIRVDQIVGVRQLMQELRKAKTAPAVPPVVIRSPEIRPDHPLGSSQPEPAVSVAEKSKPVSEPEGGSRSGGESTEIASEPAEVADSVPPASAIPFRPSSPEADVAFSREAEVAETPSGQHAENDATPSGVSVEENEPAEQPESASVVADQPADGVEAPPVGEPADRKAKPAPSFDFGRLPGLFDPVKDAALVSVLNGMIAEGFDGKSLRLATAERSVDDLWDDSKRRRVEEILRREYGSDIVLEYRFDPALKGETLRLESRRKQREELDRLRQEALEAEETSLVRRFFPEAEMLDLLPEEPNPTRFFNPSHE